MKKAALYAGGAVRVAAHYKQTRVDELMNNLFLKAPPCATFHATPELLGPVLENIMESAGNLPDSEVFSRPESFGFGRDGFVRKAGRMADSMFSTSRPPVALEKAASGFQSQSGAKPMTNVISLNSRKASHNAATTAITTTPALGNIERQQAIENALSTALYYVRQNERPGNIQAAAVKAVRAAAMLKQACAEAQNGGAVQSGGV